VVESFNETNNPALDAGLGIQNGSSRTLFITDGRESHPTMIDLVEWKHPKSSGAPPGLLNVGVPRIALLVKDLNGTMEHLKKNGVEFFSEAQTIATLARRPRFACFKDPDGVILELVEFPG
jgi:catechol 2,3-dioxygenase-like lactoylglutathione lyase family enzyme